MGLTPNHLLPYPEDTDSPDVPADIYELALRLDNVLAAQALMFERRLDAALTQFRSDSERELRALELRLVSQYERVE